MEAPPPDEPPAISPKFASERRRRERRAALFGVIAGVVVTGDGLWAVLRHGLGATRNTGAPGGYLDYPWWITAGVGLLAIAGSFWVLFERGHRR